MSHFNSLQIKLKKTQEPNINNICAIVITYHPDKELYGRIERIVSQVNKVIIVDNGSSKACIEMLKRISSDLGVYLVLDPDFSNFNSISLKLSKFLIKYFLYNISVSLVPEYVDLYLIIFFSEFNAI